MVTAARPTHHAPTNVVRGPESAPAAEVVPAPYLGINGEAIDWDKELANLVQTPAIEQPATVKRSPVSIVAHALEGFWNSLSGPAMSQREKTRQAIEEDRDVKYLTVTMTATRLV